MENYTDLKLLANTRYSKVYKARKKNAEANSNAESNDVVIKIAKGENEEYTTKSKMMLNLENYIFHYLEGSQFFKNEQSVIKKLDFGVIENTNYIVLEYCHNNSLESLIQYLHAKNFPEIYQKNREAIEQGQKVSFQANVARYSGLVKIFKRMATAIQNLFSMGILHCDLAPTNFLFGNYGYPKLLDFGISCLSSLTRETLLKKYPELSKDLEFFGTLNKEGGVLGTCHFLSPERCKCEPFDIRSEVFSLGTLFYYTLTGKHIFEEESAKKVLNDIIACDKSWWSLSRKDIIPIKQALKKVNLCFKIPDDFCDLCMSMLAIKKEERITIEQVVSKLQQMDQWLNKKTTIRFMKQDIW